MLCADAEGSIKATAIMLGEEHYGAWGALLHSVKTSEPAFEHVYGAPFFDYMAAHPDVQSTFDAAMSAGMDVMLESLGDAYDFSRSRLVVDVGGGNGSVAAMILKRNPQPAGGDIRPGSCARGGRALFERGGCAIEVQAGSR